MSWSISRQATPVAATRRRCSANIALSAASNPAAGSSRRRACGPSARARARPTSFCWPSESSFGRRRSDRSETEQFEGVADGGLARLLRAHQIVDEPAPALGADAHVVEHRQIVEQLDRLPRPHEPGADAPGRRTVLDALAGQRHPARRRREPGDRIDQARLAGAVRSDQPDDLARRAPPASPRRRPAARRSRRSPRRAAGRSAPSSRNDGRRGGSTPPTAGTSPRVHVVDGSTVLACRPDGRSRRSTDRVRPAMPDGLTITVMISNGPLISA